jgi:hydrogenase expression/formation protein HypE
LGKIPAETFDRIIKPRLGAHREDVLVGPGNGLDAGVVDIGASNVAIVTTDPFFVMPELGWERAGWFAVHILASDAAASGLRPSHLSVDLNLPAGTSDEDLTSLWNSISEACSDLDVAVITGHTGRYFGCSFPMVGGATMMGFGARAEYLSTDMTRPGDSLVITKGAAVEATGMFGALMPDLLAHELGAHTACAAAGLFHQMSVVCDARSAIEVGVHDDGVTAMHDAAEGGIWNALLEIANASGLGIAVDRDAIIVRPEARAICDRFGMDLYAASSEGTLLVTVRPHRTEALLERLARAGIEASHCGEVTSERGVFIAVDGCASALEAPIVDPFWPALQRATDEAGEEHG